MRKAYSYTAHGKCTTSGYGIDALCIFFDFKRSITALDFFDELEASLRQLDTLPDCVVVIADKPHIETLRGYWTTTEGQRLIFQQRGVRKGVDFIKRVYFVAWVPDAGLSLAYADGAGDAMAAFTLPMDSFVEQGLRALVKSNPVVQLAPAGHVFRHPSRTVSKLFIQARELATSEAEVAFVGRCLAKKLRALVSLDLAEVYIDTMGIYSFVREALTFARSSACVYSFHSYSELSELSPPTEPYAVIISASTSGGMACKLCDQGFDDSRILALIDTTTQDRAGNVLVALDDVDVTYRKQLADGTETQIELFGEHFSSKAKPPRAVTLGLPHSPKRLVPFLQQFGRDGFLGLNKQPAGGTVSRLVCFNSNVVGSNQEFLNWLNEEISWHVSVAVDHVIHANDVGSKTIAEAAADKLFSAKGCTTRPIVTCYSELSADSLAQAQGVLVVQAVAGDGGLLREISRDLREFLRSNVPRQFLVGVGLPQSEDTWSRLQQFLVKNASSRDYGFSAWLVLPVGSDGTSDAWQALKGLAARVQMNAPENLEIDQHVLTQSLDLAVRAIEDAYHGFLPTTAGMSLVLSEGFVFFGSVFDDVMQLQNVPECTTFATIAAVLQRARDLNITANQLRPSGYESVVLSPENFLRFNDNLLQACVLRAAHPSELDYSSSPHMSRLMKEFLLKVFGRHAHPYGAAALEFAAALACGRLKLLADDRRELQKKAMQSLSAEPSALLGLICLFA